MLDSTHTVWSAAEDEKLRTLISQDEYSYAQIGDIIGRKRSAVCGRVFRLGLSQPKVKTIRSRSFRSPRREYDALTKLYEQIAHMPISAPAPLGLTLLDIKLNQCHWIGETNLYCGLPVRTGSSFCGFHHRIVYRPATKRRAA